MLNIYRVAIVGGNLTKIAEKTQGGISVSPDDKQIAFVRNVKIGDNFCSLWTADADGGNEKEILIRPNPIYIVAAQWSPDGAKIAFAHGTADDGATNFSLSEIDVATGKERFIAENKFFHIKSLKWLPDGKNLIVAANAKINEPAKLWQIEIETGKTTQLSKTFEFFKSVSLDATADKMIATTIENDFRVHIHQTDSPTAPTILTEAESGRFTRDGRILYSGEFKDLWSVNPDGSGKRRLTTDENHDAYGIDSKDGRFIYFTSNRSGKSCVWQMDADGSNQKQIAKNEPGYPVFADAETVYFQAAEKKNLWKASLTDGAESVVYEKEKHLFVFSPDGAKFAFWDKTEGKNFITIVSVATGETLTKFKTALDGGDIYEIAWLPDGKEIAVLHLDETRKVTLRAHQISNGAERQIAELGIGKISPTSYLSFSPDGSKFAIVRGEWKQKVLLIKGLK